MKCAILYILLASLAGQKFQVNFWPARLTCKDEWILQEEKEEEQREN